MDKCGTYVGARWSTGMPTRSKLVFFLTFLDKLRTEEEKQTLNERLGKIVG